MSIISIVADQEGQINEFQLNIGQAPRRVKIVSTDNFATVTASGYLNSTNLQGNIILPTDFIDMVYSYSSSTNSGVNQVFLPSINATNIITLNLYVNSGNVLLPVTNGDVAVFNGTSGQIKDGGALGQAAFKAVTDNSQTAVASFNPTNPFSTSGNTLAVFTNAANGTIQSSGLGLFTIQPSSFGGGSTSNAFTFTGMTSSAKWVWASLLSATNNVAITKVVPGTNIVTISFTADPGAGTNVNIIALL
jgi:hypothetical protein